MQRSFPSPATPADSRRPAARSTAQSSPLSPLSLFPRPAACRSLAPVCPRVAPSDGDASPLAAAASSVPPATSSAVEDRRRRRTRPQGGRASRAASLRACRPTTTRPGSRSRNFNDDAIARVRPLGVNFAAYPARPTSPPHPHPPRLDTMTNHVHRSSPIAHRPLLIAHCSLLVARCSLVSLLRPVRMPPMREVNHPGCTSNGVDIALFEWPGEGTPVFLAHATGFHARCWDQVGSTPRPAATATPRHARVTASAEKPRRRTRARLRRRRGPRSFGTSA